jgi:anti-sigma B factor antagonist
MSLKITERQVGEVTVLYLVGRITLGEGSVQLREYVLRLVSENKIKVILNLAGVTYVDSSGNGEVVSALTTIRNVGGIFRCCNTRKQCRDSFQLQSLYDLVVPFETEAETIRSVELGPSLCICPGCGSLNEAERTEKTRLRPLRCQNCGAVSTFATIEKSHRLSVESIRFGTYFSEECTVIAGRPMVIQVVGRLDIFSSPALKKSWSAVPAASEVLFDLSQLTEVDDVGNGHS